ncbi:protein YchT [Escherichia coli]
MLSKGVLSARLFYLIYG